MAWARRFGLLCLLAGAAVLAGCAATNVISQVSSYGPWPEARQPGA